MEFLQQNMIWVALACISGGMLLWPMLTGGGVANLTPAQATLLMNREDALVLDVRETGEWSSGHIPGARHITLAQLDKRMSELEKFKERPIIICCASGNRSSSACGQLKKGGFEKVFSLSGGISAWLESNLPLTTKS
ncbi:MAG: sulfurtransferase [Rhodocyclales bacterium RIFCSPLOWO2_02_FULL_63_24]|nr:MAG: sulfurtransferase [Rhodocyclales bacterium GWA2_65_19]OHC67601.1 MAG: sulfurtransferase [Rhodocyclales bacterium RIFCSPLOWO2_02_FULL_63_24]